MSDEADNSDKLMAEIDGNFANVQEIVYGIKIPKGANPKKFQMMRLRMIRDCITLNHMIRKEMFTASQN